jgi:hypothetical protein
MAVSPDQPAASAVGAAPGRKALDRRSSPQVDSIRPILDNLLRTSGRLAVLADRLDEFRGKPLTREARETRDALLREQRDTRSRFEQLEARVRTLRALI